MIENYVTEETEKLVRTVLQELTVLGCAGMIPCGMMAWWSHAASHPMLARTVLNSRSLGLRAPRTRRHRAQFCPAIALFLV
jgi:hypothetical protein